MIQIESPTRFDLAAGTVDLWPLWAFLGGAVTVNVSIDIRTFCHLEKIETKDIVIESLDLKKKWSFKGWQEFVDCKDSDLLFFQAHCEFWRPTFGFKLQTRSQSPVGGGLGGSSSLSVSVFKAMMAATEKKYSTLEIVNHCSNIEAHILKTPTGTQDYFPAVSAGLHIIDYAMTGVREQILRDHMQDMNPHFLLVYTGRSHHSGINNWQVLKKFIDGDRLTIRAIEKIRDVGFAMKDVCLKKHWDQIPKLFADEFEARLDLAESFMSPEIERLKKISVEEGALGFKICGAGGGGCVVIWCDPGKKQKMIEVVRKNGFEPLLAKAL